MSDKELWRDVKGFENEYIVSNLGNVAKICKYHNHLVKKYSDLNGYDTVRLVANKKNSHKYVSQLVAEAFMSEWYPKCKVVHLDGDKCNNCLYNLKVVSASMCGKLAWNRNPRKTEQPHRVLCKDTGVIFSSCYAAARYYMVSYSSMLSWIHKGRNTEGIQFTWI